METAEHLLALGEETINSESLYLKLKIEKALQGEDFDHESQLAEAESLWREVRKEYYNFLSFLQKFHITAA